MSYPGHSLEMGSYPSADTQSVFSTALATDASKKKKRICKIVDFAVPADHRINLKECTKKNKYLDIARELKKLWNMKVTIVPIVIGAFGTITMDY